jgi:hypothetical protein
MLRAAQPALTLTQLSTAVAPTHLLTLVLSPTCLLLLQALTAGVHLTQLLALAQPQLLLLVALVAVSLTPVAKPLFTVTSVLASSPSAL